MQSSVHTAHCESVLEKLSLGMGARSLSQFCSCILKVGNRNWEEKGCVSSFDPSEVGPPAAAFPPRCS